MAVERNTSIKPVVVAVSGGVDSVVLLDMLAKNLPPGQLIVAHFDHGIRDDSHEDARFVAKLAHRYDLPFVMERAELGPHASEEAARDARYAFLQRIQAIHDAEAIITAHHQDDLIETATHNLLRGTGRRGMSSLKSTDDIWRPLLDFSKADLRRYAHQHGLHWREDSTNADLKYRRNYIRHVVIPNAESKDPAFRQKMLTYIKQIGDLNYRADKLLEEWLDSRAITDNQIITLPRHDFVMLSYPESLEVLQLILRRLEAKERNAKTLERLVVLAKTGKPRSRHDICCHLRLIISPDAKLVFGTRH